MADVGTGYPNQEWRSKLRQASFRSVPFYVQQGAKRSGRRTAVHVNPKNDIPYAEDMGRRAYQFAVTGYILGPFFFSGSFETDRDNLEGALEDRNSQGAGQLVLPTRGAFTNANGPISNLFTCVNYTVLERQIWGGYAEFEMIFHEYGTPTMQNPQVVSQAGVKSQSSSTAQSALQFYQNQTTP